MQFDDLRKRVKLLEEHEKLELVQELIQDLRLAGTVYEIFTPFGNEAAHKLTQLDLEARRPEAN